MIALFSPTTIMDLYFTTIEKFLPYLIKNYVIESEIISLVNKSFSKSFITLDDIEEIQKQKSSTQKIKKLCQKLLEIRNIPKYDLMYNMLIKEFVDKGRKDIEEELLNTLRQMRQLLHVKEKTVDYCYYETIKEKFHYLVENYCIACQIDSLVDAMYSKNFIDDRDAESIYKTNMGGDKMSILLQKLLRREGLIVYKNVYDLLVDKISKDRSDVVDELNKTLSTVKENHMKRYTPQFSKEGEMKQNHGSPDVTNVSGDTQSSSSGSPSEENSYRSNSDTNSVPQSLSTKVEEMKENSEEKSHSELSGIAGVSEENPKSGTSTLHPSSGNTSDTNSLPQSPSTKVEEMKVNSKEKSHSKSSGIAGVSKKNPKPGTSTLHPFSRYTSATMAEDLVDACRRNNVDEVKRLLDEGADVNAVKNDWPALMYSCKRGYYAIFVLLLKHSDINVNATSENGRTPLIYACVSSQPDVVKLLLNHKDIDINLATNCGTTPLMKAVVRSLDLASMLLNRPEIDVNCKNENGWTALFYACDSSQPDVVKLLLIHKDIDIDLAANNGIRPLMMAVLRSPDMTSVLLNLQEIDVNCKDENGRTALFYACDNSQLDVVKLLLNHKDIDINLATNNGITPLMMAVLRSPDMTSVLLNLQEIDVNCKDENGRTALFYACDNSQLDVVKLLLNHKDIDINLATNNGITPLMMAVLRSPDMTSVLLNRPEIDVNCKDKDGFTALIDACDNSHLDVVKLLLNHKDIDINLATNCGTTPLMVAVVRSLDLASMLLNRPEIDVNCKDKNGCTALFYACDNSQPDVVKLLLNHKDIDINLATNDGITPLMKAVVRSLDVASMLLNRPEIDVNCKDKNGWTALMVACHLQKATVVNLLLAHPGIDATTTDITCALDIAKNAGHADIVALLLPHKKGISHTENKSCGIM